MASIARLDALGIPHTGAGKDLASARAPVILERGGRALRLPAAQLGLLADQSRGARGRARHRGDPRPHRLSGAGVQDASGDPADEPAGRAARDRHLGRPPLPARLHRRRRGAAPARRHSWSRRSTGGCGEEVLDYMPEIAHAAIDAGADIVMGHGPHYSLPVGCTRARRSSTGSATCRSIPATAAASTATGSACWCAPTSGRNGIEDVRFRFVRHTEDNETYWSDPDKEADELADLAERSAAYGAKLMRNGHEVRVGRRSLAISAASRERPSPRPRRSARRT